MNMMARAVIGNMLLLVTSLSQGAGVAVLQSGSGQHQATMNIEYDDGDHVRMSVPQDTGGEAFMLYRDGRIWMVMNIQGQTMVMDVARMAAMGGVNNDDTLQQEFIRARPTGEKESVAGFAGEVYELTWKERGQTRTDRVVLSKDPVVVEYSRAWMKFADGMARSMGQKLNNSIGQYLDRNDLGLLKIGDDFQVVSIKQEKVDEKRFVLPKATMQMPMFGG